MSFASLKKNRANELAKLTSELTKVNGSTERPSEDNRFWKPEVDKAGNGYAVIRFLPAPDGEDVPYVRIWEHAFQGPGGWYIEKSLTTFGEKDPCSEYNSQLWATGTKANQEQVRKQKRKLTFIANIYVVKDAAHPENEGKVFLYKFGKKIFDKVTAAMTPEFEDEEPMNPFDLWEGANFKLKIRNVEGYRNFDKSEFDKPGPLLDSDEDLEAVYTSEHKLQPFVARDQFKTYDQLQARLFKVLGLDGTAPKPQSRAEDLPWDDTPAPVAEAKAPKAKPAHVPAATADDEDDLEFFKRLSEDE